MRISDWSSDVCSSDLAAIVALRDDHVDPRLYNLQCMFDFAHHCHDDRAVGVKAVHPRSGIAQSRRIDGHLFLDHHFHLRLERSEEHTSELQSLMRISYAVFCLKKQIPNTRTYHSHRSA